MTDLSGKTAIVTGASRGIGLGIAQALGQAGCRVACVATSEASAERGAAAVRETGSEALAFAADVRESERATEIARNMVCSWGMSDVLGPVSYGDQRNEVFLGDELMRNRNYSEDTSRAIDAEVRQILETSHKTAVELLESSRDEVERMTAALMAYETITGEDVNRILAGATVDELRPVDKKPPRVDSDKGAPELQGQDVPRRGSDTDENEGFEGSSVPVPGPA